VLTVDVTVTEPPSPRFDNWLAVSVTMCVWSGEVDDVKLASAGFC
jgi:hypothetical protein